MLLFDLQATFRARAEFQLTAWTISAAITATTSNLMAHFDAVLPGRIHRVQYETMVDDTENEVRRLLDYCGLPFEDGVPALFRKRTCRAHGQFRTGAATDLQNAAWINGTTTNPGSARCRPRWAISREKIPKPRSGLYTNTTLHILIGPDSGKSPHENNDQQNTRIRRVALPAFAARAAIHLACFAPAFADTNPDADPQDNGSASSSTDQTKAQQLGEITVTAQKRTENVQSVPISMDVLTTDKLTEMNVSDVVRLDEAVADGGDEFVARRLSAGLRTNFDARRGSGSNGNHSGPQPSVGIYLDEQPITTAVGAIDPHIYDIQRIEALAGPQGTLYGASSEAGTMRIITNKPDPTAFSASVSHGSEHDRHGDTGYTPKATSTFRSPRTIALRVVGL